MGEIYQRPDALLADYVTQQHAALGVHQDGLDANVQKMQALNELMNICSNAKEDAGDKAKGIVFSDPARVRELKEQVIGIGTKEFDAMLTEWVRKLESEENKDNPNYVDFTNEQLKKFERELSTANRSVEMDIQTIMNRFSYFKDMLYQYHTIAQSTQKSIERLHEALMRVGRY